MEIVGYVTREKFIWTSSEGCINKNKITKQGIPKININMIYSSSTLGFGFYHHKKTCDILSEMLVSHRLKVYSSKK